MIEIFIYLVLVFLINFIIKKKKLILSVTGFHHQSFVNNPVPLTGGIFFLVPTIYLFLSDHLIFLCAYILLFLLGLLSDLKIFESAKKRFLIQLIIILLFVTLSKLQVTPTKIDFLDDLIGNTYWSYLFTAFCLMILINGSNFIDGLNGLLLGYFSLIIIFLFNLDLIYSMGFSETVIRSYFIVIFFILLLNFFNQLFLGDSGAYSISFLVGFLLIEIYNNNQNISPYFIIVLLWYPCFENLFSIIRKNFRKKNPLEPDTEHFHQKLFIFFKQKLKLSGLKSNVLSSILILFSNSIIFFVASKAVSHSIFQICLLIVCISLYLSVYLLVDNMIDKNN